MKSSGCGKPTTMEGTGLCDECWELKSRIERSPAMAREFLREVDSASFEMFPLPNLSLDGMTVVLRISLNEEGQRKVVADSVPTFMAGPMEEEIAKAGRAFCEAFKRHVKGASPE